MQINGFINDEVGKSKQSIHLIATELSIKNHVYLKLLRLLSPNLSLLSWGCHLQRHGNHCTSDKDNLEVL